MNIILQMKTWVLSLKYLCHDLGQVAWKFLEKNKKDQIFKLFLKKKKLSCKKIVLRWCRLWLWSKRIMRTEVNSFIDLMIVIRVNLVLKRPFDLKSPLNGCMRCEIVFVIKCYVIDVQSRLMCVVIETIVAEIKWRLSYRTWRQDARKSLTKI